MQYKYEIQLVGSLLLTNSNFYRAFTDDPAFTSAATALPQMLGSSLARDLRAALSRSSRAAMQSHEIREVYAVIPLMNDMHWRLSA